MAIEVASYPLLPSERAELARSEEEETLLRDIREEKERLWVEIQVRVSVIVRALLLSNAQRYH